MAKKQKATVKNPLPVEIVSNKTSAPISDKKYDAQEKKWQAEEDLRTMQRAREIEKDKCRVTAVKQLAKEQMNALKKV